VYALLARLQAEAIEAETRLRRLAPRQQGQGTVEYVALVTLVALVMVGVLAAMKSTQFSEGQQLGSLILKKIAQAVEKVRY
jgi:Flp pilus assembly pilin Flp